MSSVTRFIRQVPVSTTYYNVNSAFLAGTNAYEFVPAGGNYVGNYPPGYVQLASSVAQVAAQLATQGSTSDLILRDMGKTIFAPIGTSATPTYGYFRQVQLLKPTGISSTQGFIGGLNGSTFGVLGGANIPDNNTSYYTFYIAVPVGGVLGGVLSGLTPIAGGQM